MKKIIFILFLFFISIIPVYAEERGIFISYIELSEYVKGNSINSSKKNINDMIGNLYKSNFNTIYLQVRSHDDAIYKSKEFKVSPYIKLNDGKSFDVLKYFIVKCKKKNIKVYAWINPFRIENGKFYDPADKTMQKHILKGIDEVMNYNINGIIFDDYFYQNDDMDLKEYNLYIKKSYISKKDFHLMVIRDFLYEVNKRIKKKNKNVLFGISPSGNIDNLYNKDFVDIKKLTKNKKYMDFVMPQVYYGFLNSAKPYYETIKEWESISNIPTIYALPLYKSGNLDNYAGKGKKEFINNNDIIEREIVLARNRANYKGFSIYRYDNMFNENYLNDNLRLEIKNIKKVMAKK